MAGCFLMHILSRSIVHASLALFCPLQILLGGCLGLHSLSRHTVHASWSFFCLLQIPLGGPSCKQGCLCSNTLTAGSIISRYDQIELPNNLMALNQIPYTELFCR